MEGVLATKSSWQRLRSVLQGFVLDIGLPALSGIPFLSFPFLDRYVVGTSFWTTMVFIRHPMTEKSQKRNPAQRLRGAAHPLKGPPTTHHGEKAHSYRQTVVVQNDVPTTDLSKNGKLKKGRPERAGKPMSSAKPWRTLRRRCQLDLVARTPTIKSYSISSLFLTPPEA